MFGRSNKYTHLDRNSLVRSMEIEQIDEGYSEPLQRLFQRFFDICRASIDYPAGSVKRKSEFGGQEDVIPLSGTFEPVYV